MRLGVTSPHSHQLSPLITKHAQAPPHNVMPGLPHKHEGLIKLIKTSATKQSKPATRRQHIREAKLKTIKTIYSDKISMQYMGLRHRKRLRF